MREILDQKISETQGIKPRAIWFEVKVLPLCYATPYSEISLLDGALLLQLLALGSSILLGIVATVSYSYFKV